MLGLRTGLCLAIAVAVTGLTMAQAGSAATQTPFKASLAGSFAFGAPCPASAPAGAVCLVDNVTGTASHLGRVSGQFVVAFDFSAIDADNCLPIRKTGSFEAANGDTLNVDAPGTYCLNTGVAHYNYSFDGGTGRFAHASGSGSWDVPPPATFDGSTGQGTGPESLGGTIAY